MVSKKSKKECFEKFGVSLRNERWSWSGRNDDGSKVVLTFWKDFFKYGTNPPTYVDKGWGEKDDVSRLGNKYRIEDITWALDHCDGLVFPVIAVADDLSENPRKISRCYPAEGFKMRITEFDPDTGEFSAVQVV